MTNQICASCRARFRGYEDEPCPECGSWDIGVDLDGRREKLESFPEEYDEDEDDEEWRHA